MTKRRMKTKPTRSPGGSEEIQFRPYPHAGEPMQQQAARALKGQNTK
jgi:hypothetical protein